MTEYLKKLIKQYQEAFGINHVDINSKDFLDEFYGWLDLRSKCGKMYVEFVNSLGIDVLNPGVVEVGKGIYDSVLLNSGSAIITPYYKDMSDKNNVIIPGSMKILGNTPVVVNNDSNKNLVVKDISQDFERFITQNPYDKSELSGWNILHNSGREITVGIFGNKFDSDIRQKIILLKELKENMLEYNVMDEFITAYDSYAYILSSKITNPLELRKRL